MTQSNTTPRPLATIAREIRTDWPNPYFGAVPYLGAMLSLQSINDAYGLDTARSIVQYFLANAKTWRGDTARRIKAELKSILATPSRRVSLQYAADEAAISGQIVRGDA
jgi:hypothetical protein